MGKEEGDKQKEAKRKKGREEKKGQRRKKKRIRDSLDLGRSGLSHFQGFPKVLREWIPGFGGRKDGRQRGSSHESYRYERCMLLQFLLRLTAFEVCSLVLGN